MAQAPGSIETASLTDVGLQRSENQDAFAERVSSDGSRLLVVADGMGGHRGGATASRLAVEHITRCFEGRAGQPAPALLRAAFESANRAIREQGDADPALKGMGTTAVALLLEPAHARACVAHVGDSRLYRLRAGRLDALTRDHSLRREMLEHTQLTCEQVDRMPAAHAVLRALGVDARIDVEVSDLRVEPADIFLLCSDGLWDLVSPERIGSVLAQHRAGEAARILIDQANRCGGTDNITVQIAAVPSAAPAPRAELPDARPRLSRTGQAVLATASLIAGVLLVMRLAGTLAPELAADETSAPRSSAIAPVDAGVRAALAPLASVPEGEIQPEPTEERTAPVSRGGPPGPIESAPALRASPAVFSAIVARLLEYQQAVQICDFAALERVAVRAAQRRARALCAGGAAAHLTVSVEPSSLRALGPREYRVELLEHGVDRQQRLQATLQSRPDGSLRLTELAER